MKNEKKRPQFGLPIRLLCMSCHVLCMHAFIGKMCNLVYEAPAYSFHLLLGVHLKIQPESVSP